MSKKYKGRCVRCKEKIEPKQAIALCSVCWIVICDWYKQFPVFPNPPDRVVRHLSRRC